MRGLIIKKQADIFYVQPLQSQGVENFQKAENSKKIAKNALKMQKKPQKTENFVQNGEVLACVARKNLKKSGAFVGDYVEIDDSGAIAKIEERKNLLIRPPLANLDRMFIVVAPVPKPDLYTVDKLIVFCRLNGIEPILCINKSDLNENLCKQIEKTYKKVVKTLIFSTLNESVLKLQRHTKGICALAGQSAVGKSSIINALKKEAVAKVDTFSKKIERGKQTTRTVQLYSFGKGRFLADTAGFSKLDESLLKIDERELKGYYPEFLAFAPQCKYSSCQHLSAKDCAVAQAVSTGKIAEERYQNYLKLHSALKNLKKY